ncbi:MAG: hypothetical protein IRZ17_20115, partial [Mycolicibacterium hassiacum]|uniref:transporter associated domain-containing protein n=1 Tax=Mycolicibacterium hassiacum TaxID=46351 RepID=UPI0023F70939
DVVRGGRGWRVSGLLRIDEVAAATGFRAPEGDYETIGGLVLEELGHIPQAGESVVLRAMDPNGTGPDSTRWLATVVQMEGRRIDVVEITQLPEEVRTDG